MSSQFQLNLIRKNLAVSGMLSLSDEHFLEEPEFKRKTFEDTINDVKIQYSKRDAGAALLPIITHIVCDDLAFHVLTSDGLLWSAAIDGWLLAEPGDHSIDLIPAVTDVLFTSIYCNWESRCGLDAIGQVWYWGSQWGPEWGCGFVWADRFNPDCPGFSYTAVAGGGELGEYEYVMMATSWPTCIGVTADGKIYGWGFIEDTWDSAGLGGAYSNENVIWPVQEATGKTDWVSCFAGRYASAAIDSSGQLWNTGDARYGRMGHGDETQLFQFTQVGNKTDWVWAGFGELHAAGLDTSGDVWVWGYSGHGALGDSSLPSYQLTPFKLDPSKYGNKNVVQVSCGIYNTYILCSDGTLYVTGENYDGECGLGHNNDVYDLTPITSHLFTMIAAGLYNAMGVTTDDEVCYWGYGPTPFPDVSVPTVINWPGRDLI
jgi:alpha-tubulin suppressor-like RCC1 family protein